LRIRLNGEDIDLPDGSTIGTLLAGLSLPGGPVAVEVNREIVRRQDHETSILRDGDRVEVVTLVGGG
jgi:sulfur carrier protein